MGGIIMELLNFIFVFTFVIVFLIAVYLGTAMLSNVLFHKIYLNKFELFASLQNKIIDSGKEKVVRKSIKYLTILLFFLMALTSKGVITIYSMVIMGIVMGFVSPIIFNDKEATLYKQIHFHKGWFMRR
jgi:hypothetical protein